MPVIAELIEGLRAFRVNRAFAEVPIEFDVTVEDEGVHVVTASATGASAVGLVLPCGLDEHFVGFGEQFTQLDKRGRVIDGWVGASVNRAVTHAAGLDGGYKVWPVWYSSSGYAAILDTTLRFRVEMAVRHPRQVVARVPGEQIRLVLIEGDPAMTIGKVTQRTGRPPLAPHWAFGVWKCTLSGPDAIAAETARLRQEALPTSAVWIYDQYDPRTNTGCGAAGTYPKGEYGDLPGLVRRLHGDGFRAMTYVTPFVYRDTPAYDRAIAADAVIRDGQGDVLHATALHPTSGDDLGLLAETGLNSMRDGAAVIDFTRAGGRDYWRETLRRILVEDGFDGWMEDFGEGLPEGSVVGDGTPFGAASNRYPVDYHSASKEVIDDVKPDALFFARSGWLGAQAAAPVFWPGDQTRDWSSEAGIAAVPAAGIALSLMGVAAWGPDIGGNMGFPSVGGGYGGGSDDTELWVRWCQLGAMSPVFRDHLSFHAGVPVDLWTNDDTIDCWRQTATWYLGMFPYLWSLAHDATTSGLPIMRALLLEWPDHEESWTLANQYLLGDALLCAPVLEFGARSRRLWLPPDQWFDVWTEERHNGPGWVEVPAPLDRWPVLQRAGTILPRLLEVPLDINDERFRRGQFDLELRVAPGEGGDRRLFDGTTIQRRAGAMEVRSPRGRRVRVVTVAGEAVAEGTGEIVRLPAPL